MVKEVVWSSIAESDLLGILDYYYQLEAYDYARKLNEIFAKEITSISKLPFIGKGCNATNVRVKIISHYQVIYEISESFIFILRVWDSRQDISKLTSGHRKK